MSVIQNADWPTIIEMVVCIILIVAIAIGHLRLWRLNRELERLSEDVKYLAAAEQRRFMPELNSARQIEQKLVA
jgi:hypothetical protein